MALAEKTPENATVTWAPQPGPQTALIHCTWADEIFFGGARGGGKTDASTGRFLIKALQFGKGAKGIFLRRELPQLEPLIARARELYEPHGASWRENTKTLRFPNGANCKFRFLDKDSDAEKYQGHDYTDVMVEEAGNFPSSAPIMKLKGTLRSARGIPCQMILTGNPGGPGQGWIRVRYIDPNPNGYFPIKEVETRAVNGKQVNIESTRIYIPSRITDNQILLDSDPGYISRLAQTGSEQLVKAWLDGDFYTVEGAFFDCWSHHKHGMRPAALPDWWMRFRAADWGSAKPFCILWIAVAGEDWIHPVEKRKVPRGALIVYREWYGVKTRQDGTIEPNTGVKMFAEPVATGILAREEKRENIQYGVMDPSAFSVDGGPSIAERMFYATAGKVAFRRADNRRIGALGALSGWDQVRSRMVGEEADKQGQTIPMLYAFSSCVNLIRTIPSMQHDPDRPEDCDTTGEDHACFAAGTLVDTAIGPQPIEKLVGTEGVVGTSQGDQRYTHCALTRKSSKLISVLVSDGSSVLCTEDHKWLTTQGWVEARDLKGKTLCRRLRSTTERASLMAADTSSTRPAISNAGAEAISTELYTSFTTATCLDGSTSTTSMEAERTTRSRTLLHLLASSTSRCTLQTLSAWIKCAPLRAFLCSPFPPFETLRSFVKFAARPIPSRATHGVGPSFVRQNAATSTDTALRSSGTGPWFARLAANPAKPSAKKPEPAHTRADGYCVAVTPAGVGDVFCLVVPGVGDFRLANGWIVKNCDALRYGCMSRPYLRQENQKQKRPRTIQEVSLNELYESIEDDRHSSGRL